ncbi:unnamed protein product, partial [marine sediment metagenome]
GYHFKETLELRDKYKKLGFNIVDIYPEDRNPDPKLPKEDPELCCQKNKVEPLSKILNSDDYDAWITGISRAQSETRLNTRYLEKTKSTKVKINPLISWQNDEIWQYIREKRVPYNPLFDQGYSSIGCEPCTTKVKPGEDVRAGRWRGTSKKECGLHTEL